MSIYTTYKPAGDNDLYLRLKDGDSVKLRIASEPAITLYQEGQKPRYAWVIYNRDLNKPQVYNAGVSVFTQIADLAESWDESPTEFDIAIKRTGAGLQDTSYSVVPLKKSEDLTKDQLAEIEKIDLIQATKGKWLADYVDDGKLPDPINSEPTPDVVAEVPDDGEIQLSDIPF